MNIELISKKDLDNLKSELINEIRNIRFTKSNRGSERKEWLKSYEVREMLGISSGTLQNLRHNGTIPFCKVGGLIFYKYQDIERILSNGQ